MTITLKRAVCTLAIAPFLMLAGACVPKGTAMPPDPFPSGIDSNDERMFDPGDCQPPYVLMMFDMNDAEHVPASRSGTISVTGVDAQAVVIKIRDRKTGVITPVGATTVFKAQSEIKICLEYGLAPTLSALVVVIRVTNTKKGDYYFLNSETWASPGLLLVPVPADNWFPPGGPWQTTTTLHLG